MISDDMTLEDFKKETKNDLNPEGFMFDIVCKKCGSDNILFEHEFDYSEGSEYTGIYDESITMIIKCLKCGNAFSVTR